VRLGDLHPCARHPIGWAFQEFIPQGGRYRASLTIFTGGRHLHPRRFALGILPFINASIILQLLTAPFAQLEGSPEERKGGPDGRKDSPRSPLCGPGLGRAAKGTVFA